MLQGGNHHFIWFEIDLVIEIGCLYPCFLCLVSLDVFFFEKPSHPNFSNSPPMPPVVKEVEKAP